ncbi:uncharacterized protein LY79DRAFT_559569 [Colletotrichum navitas]|uniref:Uncharacterized protein n=1 Tax=Colletotrichum navitas TaxID=681940 RepID=A0AAD8PW29_9PEZI|nr:uncharacterized protein LY79DRAFT_559569 [Colletotrichum navitas]KAK1585029.1 hypothetical protein LY79DRAFT_559569 [Colletotrichum navitas]
MLWGQFIVSSSPKWFSIEKAPFRGPQFMWGSVRGRRSFYTQTLRCKRTVQVGWSGLCERRHAWRDC